ncbi:hypothetical protein BSKO_00453 [Bryopsis sp. KO-2023]|nr:hypothetical protein BSKO_00453 [Bryopsis sp. KO-2023]
MIGKLSETRQGQLSIADRILLVSPDQSGPTSLAGRALRRKETTFCLYPRNERRFSRVNPVGLILFFMQRSYMATSTTPVPCIPTPLISHFGTPMSCGRKHRQSLHGLTGNKVLKDMALVSVASLLTRTPLFAEACSCSDPTTSNQHSEESGFAEAAEPEPYVCTCGSTNTARQSTASLTSAVGLLRPTSFVRTLQCTRQPCSGPMSVLLVLLTTVMSIWAAVRSAVAKRVKECSSCRGFGIERCNLCFGNGVCSWEGKYAHDNEPCPRCFGRRFVKCQSCGGHYHRPMFHHARTTRFSLVKDLLEIRPEEEEIDNEEIIGQVPRLRT